jgi:hypothetical protein
MATNGSWVDIDFILDKLYHDYKFDDIEYNEVAEDIWDAINYVADPSSYETKFADIVIADYKGTMPSDFFSIVDGTVMEKETNIPLVGSLDLMDRFSDNATILAETDALKYSYKIIEGYLYTGLEDTTLTISYKAFPVSNNLPLVPDNAKAIRMVVDYIAEKIAFKLFMVGKLGERVYEKILQRSCWSTSSWKTSSKIPTTDVMERLKNIHLNLLRNPNMHDNQFKHLGTRSKVFVNPVDENQDLNNTINFTLTATSNGQTEFDRPTTVSANNLETVASLGTWTATISGTEYTLTYGTVPGTDISYNRSTDVITYSDANYGALAINDTIEFLYNIQ